MGRVKDVLIDEYGLNNMFKEIFEREILYNKVSENNIVKVYVTLENKIKESFTVEQILEVQDEYIKVYQNIEVFETEYFVIIPYNRIITMYYEKSMK